jgi:hypothetical protein
MLTNIPSVSCVQAANVTSSAIVNVNVNVNLFMSTPLKIS